MHKCSKSKIFLVCLRQIVCLRPIGSKSVTVVECVNPCIPADCRVFRAHVFADHVELLCGVVTQSLERRTYDQVREGSTPGRAPLRSNLGQVIHTYAPLLPSSIIWHWLKSDDVLRLGR